MKHLLAVLVYAVAPLAAVAVAISLSPLFFRAFSKETMGEIATALFAGLFFGELTQQSIGKFYEAIATASLKTSELEDLYSKMLGKIRGIRRVFLLSNIVKLIGIAASIYLAKEKASGANLLIAFDVTAAALIFSVILFAELWAEVNHSENILSRLRYDAISKEKREQFLKESRSQKTQEIPDDDDAARSFLAKPRPST